MKSFFFFSTSLLATTLTAQNAKQNNVFTLSGKVEGQDSGYVHLNYVNSSGQYQQDSCYLKAGAFEFKGSITEPTLADFVGNTKSRSVEDPNFNELFLEPGKMQALFEVDNFKQGNLSGSKANDEFLMYKSSRDRLDKKWKPVFDNLKVAMAKKDTALLEDIYDNQLPRYRMETQNLSLQFIRRFPNSYVSAHRLFYEKRNLSLDSLKEYYALLSPVIRDSRDGKGIADLSRIQKVFQ